MNNTGKLANRTPSEDKKKGPNDDKPTLKATADAPVMRKGVKDLMEEWRQDEQLAKARDAAPCKGRSR